MTALVAFLLALAPQALEARAVCTPAEAEIGQPIECALELAHPRDVAMRVKGELELDDSWVLLEERRLATSADGTRTTARWVVASLEPGERTLALPAAEYRVGGATHTLAAEPARVQVRPALAEGEDAPRPARGFREPPAAARGGAGSPLVAVALGAAFVALLALVVALVRRKPAREEAPALSASAELARLAERPLEEPAAVRALYFELSRLARRAVDERLGRDRRGLTDAEWLEAVAGEDGLSSAAHTQLGALLASCERVKYGQETPTRWAAQESLASARALVEGREPAAPAEAAR